MTAAIVQLSVDSGSPQGGLVDKMADLSQPNNPFITNPDDHLARLLAPEVESRGIGRSFRTSRTLSTRPSCRRWK